MIKILFKILLLLLIVFKVRIQVLNLVLVLFRWCPLLYTLLVLLEEFASLVVFATILQVPYLILKLFGIGLHLLCDHVGGLVLLILVQDNFDVGFSF